MGEWSEARIGLMLKMREDGKSNGRIAKALGGGVTRNAVADKLARLGLDPAWKSGLGTGRTPGNSTMVRRVRQARAGAPMPVAPALATAVPVSRKRRAAGFDAARLAEAVPLEALGGDQCRFAVSANDVGPAEHRFCALPVADCETGLFDPRRRYCRHHVERVIARDGKAGA